MEFFVAQILTGLANASSLFLVACGLSLIFGVTRIVNFAHGSLYMLGAYVGYSLMQVLPGAVGFWGAILLAGVAVGLVGVLIEMLVLRPVYRAPELFQLVATFGVILVIQDLTLIIWGPEDLLGPRAPGLRGVYRILGEPIPKYDIVLLVITPFIALALWWLITKTRVGVLVRAATQDREMVGALGVNQRLLFTTTFMLGAFLAGLGGALQVPREAVSLLMDLSIIGEAFVVVVIGGMGSVTGAFVAAVLISVLNAFGILVFPQISLILPFLVMAVVLVTRPYGLFGTAASAHGAPTVPETPLRALPPIGQVLIVLAVVAV
ncbi:MAG: branched-chain amino acid ABC transporter permease, partial [Pseudomonadota bacterium]